MSDVVEAWLAKLHGFQKHPDTAVSESPISGQQKQLSVECTSMCRWHRSLTGIVVCYCRALARLTMRCRICSLLVTYTQLLRCLHLNIVRCAER